MKPIFSAHILAANDKGEILLVKRRDVPVWVIPGGTTENDESPEETAVREFYEETGIKVSKGNIRLSVHYLSSKARGRDKYTFVTRLSAKQKPTPTSESSRGDFFPIKQLPEPISVYEEHRIHDVFSRSGKTSILKKEVINYAGELSKLSRKPIVLIYLIFRYFIACTRRKPSHRF